MEYGPVEAGNLEAAKAQIRKRLGVNRLPLGLQVWDLAEHPLTRWRVDAAS
jgi:coproporphyrinogen III oxidase-like Fe-S oxidoreductase